MSVWYSSSKVDDSSNIYMYKGDYGEIKLIGLPGEKNYRAYFSIKSIKTNEILLETSADIVDKYWVDENDEIIVKDPYETEEEYEAYCEYLSKLDPPEAFKKGKATIILTPEMTTGLPMMNSQETTEFYFGIKVCCAEDGDEDTLIPAVKYDDNTGEYVFQEAPHFILRQKYVEGILPFKQYCDMDEAEKNPKDYGLQPLLTPGQAIEINEDNVISCTINSDNFQEKLIPGNGIEISEDNVISATNMVGATDELPGKTGLVPIPEAGDNRKFLCGDGTWKSVGGSGDGSSYRSLTEEQALDLKVHGTYNNIEVNNGEIFTRDDGTFQKFIKKMVTTQENFVEKQPFPVTSSCNVQKSSNGNYIATVKGTSTSYISNDGEHWNVSGGGGYTFNNSGLLLYKDDIAIAGSNMGAEINYSSDNGLNWRRQRVGDVLANKGCIAGDYFFGFYFAFTSQYSSDGINWNTIGPGYRFACYDGNRYLVGNDIIYETTDFENYSSVGTNPCGGTILELGYNAYNQKYYVLGVNGILYSSSDLTNWIPGNYIERDDWDWNKATNFMFIDTLVAFQIGNTLYMTTDDGLTYKQITVPSKVSKIDNEFWYINDGFIYYFDPDVHPEYSLDTLNCNLIKDNNAPGYSTPGYIGQIWVDITNPNGIAYICVGHSGSTYYWKQITA